MHRVTMSFIVFCCGGIAAAEDAALRSCGLSSGVRDGPSYVTLDSPGYPAVEVAMNKLADGDPIENLIAIAAIGDFMQMPIMDAAVPASAIICGYDMFDANGCGGLPFMPNAVESASMLGEKLQFTTKIAENGLQAQFEFASRAFDDAVITSSQGDQINVNSWTRRHDGTEVFLSTSSTGAESSYTENPDCSGKGHTIRYNEAGLLATNDFSWTSAKDSGFAFQFEVCRFQEPNIGCESGRI